MDIHRHVTELLQAKGIQASYEYPGYIAIADWAIGTANGKWEMDLMTGEGAHIHTIDLGIPGSSQDALAIAEAIRICAATADVLLKR